MQEVDQVSSLIRDIYDAALDPALWVDVLGKAGDFVGGSAAVLYSKDGTRKSASIYYDDGGIDPHYKQLYLDQYVKLDPTSTAEFFVDGRATYRHRRSHPLRRVPANAPLPGMGAPAGPGGPSAGCAREISDQHCLLRRLSRSTGGRRRRRDAPAHAPHRPARSPRHADRPTDRSQDRRSGGIRRYPRWYQRRHVPRRRGRADGPRQCQRPRHAGRALRAACGGRQGRRRRGRGGSGAERVVATAGGGDAAVGAKGIAVPLAARDGERYMAHVLPLTSGERRRAGAELCGRRRAVRAQGGAGRSLAAGGHRQALQADAERAARAARHRPGRRRAGGRRGAGHRRGHGQDASAPPVRQDRHQPPGRARQAGGRVLQSLVG